MAHLFFNWSIGWFWGASLETIFPMSHEIVPSCSCFLRIGTWSLRLYFLPLLDADIVYHTLNEIILNYACLEKNYGSEFILMMPSWASVIRAMPSSNSKVTNKKGFVILMWNKHKHAIFKNCILFAEGQNKKPNWITPKTLLILYFLLTVSGLVAIGSSQAAIALSLLMFPGNWYYKLFIIHTGGNIWLSWLIACSFNPVFQQGVQNLGSTCHGIIS